MTIASTIVFYPNIGTGNAMYGEARATMTFQKSRFPATGKGENLLPSTCAWLDRGIGSDEPSSILVDSSAAGATGLFFTLSSAGTGEAKTLDISSTLDDLRFTNMALRIEVAQQGTNFVPNPAKQIVPVNLNVP